MIQIEARIVRPERGRDLTTINETIFDNADFNDKLATPSSKTPRPPRTPKQTDGAQPGRQPKQSSAPGASTNPKRSDDRKTKKQHTPQRRAHSVVEAAIIGAGTHTQRYFSTRDDLKKQLTERRALAQRHAREGSLRERQQTRRQHRGLPQTMDAKERRTQWVEQLKLQDRTDPSNPQNLPPGEADKEADHTKIAAAFTTFFAAMHIEPRAKAKAIKTLGKGNRVLPPTAAKCDADIAPKTKSSIPPYLRVPPNRQEPSRAQDLTASRTSYIGSSRGHRPNPYPILTNVFNESRRKGELPEGIRRGIISVLYKMKDRDEPTTHATIDPSH